MEIQKRDLTIIAIISLIITILFISYEYSRNFKDFEISSEASPTFLAETFEEREPEPIRALRVFISGAVLYPNVYELEDGARISDLIDMAGGVLEDANIARINLAARIRDAEHIFIPRIGEEELFEEISAEAEEDDGDIAKAQDEEVISGLININTASHERLTSLPGIGPAIATNIITYRELNGGFRTIEEIMLVSRIGESLFGQIQHLITVGEANE